MSAPEEKDAGKPRPEKTRVAHQWKHSSPLISCRFDPRGSHVFAGAQDSTVQRWDLETGKATAFRGHESWVRGLAFLPGGETLITGGFDGRLIWWPALADNPSPLRTVEAHDGWVRAVAVSPAGDLVATAGNDHRVKLWSAADGRAVRTLEGHECHVYNVAFHPDGKALVSADLKGVVKHWDLESGQCSRQLDASALYKHDTGFRADIGGVRAMTFSADGRLLACGGITNVSNAFAGVGNPMVLLLDWEKGEVLRKHVSQKELRGVAWGVAFHPDGYLIGASGGGGGGFLFFWKDDQDHEFHKLKLPNTARDLALHPDGRRLATAHYDGHIRISLME